MQAELIKKAWQWCDEANAICHAHEAAIFDYIVELPVWSQPAELLASLCSPDENTAPGTTNYALNSNISGSCIYLD